MFNDKTKCTLWNTHSIKIPFQGKKSKHLGRNHYSKSEASIGTFIGEPKAVFMHDFEFEHRNKYLLMVFLDYFRLSGFLGRERDQNHPKGLIHQGIKAFL